MGTYYRWDKTQYGYYQASTLLGSRQIILDSGYNAQIVYGRTQPTVSQDLGKFILPTRNTLSTEANVEFTTKYVFGISGQIPTEEINGTYHFVMNSYYGGIDDNDLYVNGEYGVGSYCESLSGNLYTSGVALGKIGSPSQVYSTSSTAYPNNGSQDGYWYEYSPQLTQKNKYMFKVKEVS